MVLVNATKKTTVSDHCRFANTVFKRMVGLLGRKKLDEGEGLLLDRCYGVHTFFMRFPIDVLFLDRDLRVMRAVPALPAFRVSIVRQAVYVLELPVGAIERARTEAGDQIQMRTVVSDNAGVGKAPVDKTQPAAR